MSHLILQYFYLFNRESPALVLGPAVCHFTELHSNVGWALNADQHQLLRPLRGLREAFESLFLSGDLILLRQEKPLSQSEIIFGDKIQN